MNIIHKIFAYQNMELVGSEGHWEQPFMQEKGGYLHLTDAETKAQGSGDSAQAQRTGDGFLIRTPFSCLPHTLVFWASL